VYEFASMGEMRNAYKSFVPKTAGKRRLSKRIPMCGENIDVDVEGMRV
jgi:hypothetical protein